MPGKELPVQFADWRNPSEYPDPEKTDGVQWMWQFLRRNLDYQNDYQVFINTPGAHCLNLKNKGQKNRELYYKYLKEQKGFAEVAEMVSKWFLVARISVQRAD